MAERFVDEQGRRVTDMFAPQMRTREKAELVAALVNAAPALLDELARLRVALKAVRPKIKAFLPISPIPAEQDILAIIDAALAPPPEGEEG